MGTNFGALTDHFSVLEIAGLTAALVLVDSSKTVVARSMAEAKDENDDIAAAEWYGATDIYECSSTFDIKSGTPNINSLKIGEVTAGKVITSCAISTSNGKWPQIVVTGKTGLETITAPTSKANTWTLPSLTIKGMKQAQPLGFTILAGKLNSCSIEFSCELAESLDGLGVPVAHGVSGATGKVSAEFTNTAEAQPAWTLTLSGLTSTQEPGTEEGQAAFHTSSAAAEMILSRDAAA